MGSTPFPALIANIPGKPAKRRPEGPQAPSCTAFMYNDRQPPATGRQPLEARVV